MRPYQIADCTFATSASDDRSVFGCFLTSFVNVPSRSIASASWWRKSAVRRYGPCSSTTIRKPARDNSRAITPPAAPEPTITKSTSVCLLGMFRDLPILIAERRLPREAILEADELPAGFLEVAAVLRIRQHADDGG